MIPVNASIVMVNQGQPATAPPVEDGGGGLYFGFHMRFPMSGEETPAEVETRVLDEAARLRALCATRQLPGGCAVEVVPALPIERIGTQDLDSGAYLVTYRVPFQHADAHCPVCARRPRPVPAPWMPRATSPHR